MGLIRTAWVGAVCLLAAACGGQPEGALIEIAVSLAEMDEQHSDALDEYRTYRVQVLSDLDPPVVREVDRVGPPPDVFVIRSPLAVASADDGSFQVRVEALDYSVRPAAVLACRQKPLTVLEDALTHVDVVLEAGECR